MSYVGQLVVVSFSYQPSKVVNLVVIYLEYNLIIKLGLH